MEIAFHHDRPIQAAAVRSLYSTVGWWPDRTEEDIGQALQDALAVGAWDGGRLVGFARAVSDRHFRAFIEDVVVHPDYQRRGVGTRLLTRLLNELSRVETISLFCETSLAPFYEAQGFHSFPSQRVLHLRRVPDPDSLSPD